MKKNWKKMGVWILLVGILFNILPSLSVRADINEQKTIRIGYIDYEGFIVPDGEDSYTGYGVDYLEELSKYTDWNYEYVYDSWENHLLSLASGEIDFLCHAQKTKEREQLYLFSKYSGGAESSVLYVGKEDDRYYYNDFDHFNGMKVAVLSNSFQNDEFLEFARKKGFTYDTVVKESQQACFDALDAGEVDAVNMGSLALKTNYKIVCRYGMDPFYFITGKQNQDLMEELNDAMGELMAVNPTFATDIYNKYYGDEAGKADVIFTREEKEFIERAGTIEVAYIPNRKPFSYLNQSGEVEGITVDIMRLIREKSGLDLNFSMMKEGETPAAYLNEHPQAFVAGIMSDNPAFESADYLLSDIFYTDDVALACKIGLTYDLNAPDETYTLAVPKSYMALKSYITKNYPQFFLIECATTEECIKMVVKDQADFMAQNVNVVTPLLQDPHYEGTTVLPTFFMDENMGIVSLMSEDNQVLMDIFDKCIASISAKEVSQFTVNHTVTNSYRLSWLDMIYKFRYPVIAIALLLAVIIVLLIGFNIIRNRNYQKLGEKNTQLANAVAQADDANQAKSQFLARMSHEIRTPMNAIVGLTTICKHHKTEPEKVEEYLSKIETSSTVLLNIINDVLDMSAIESNKIKIAENPFNLREILTSISTIYYPQCSQKGLVFEMNTAEIIHENLIGDGLRVNQILLNLVSNAYKFTEKDGKITITAEEMSTRDGKAFFKFSVKDTGEGMTEEMQKRLFRPFEQEEAKTAQKHGGSGLGLSIAKNLVELMEGSISCQSKKGEGTTFTVLLPLKIDKDVEMNTSNGYKTIRALIVDDEEETREYTSVILNRIGVPYVIAVDGADAVNKLTRARELDSGFDICFVDWVMPGMSGYEVTKKIRDMFKKDTLIIIVSAYDTSEIEEEAIKAGADLFLSKPLFQSTVFNLLMKLSGGKYINHTAEKKDYDFSGKKILLAEDTDFNAEIAVELLEMVNMKTDRAKDGKEALDMFLASKPGEYMAILMDVQMPVMDGYEATREIRLCEHAEAVTIPIYAMTANAFTEDVSTALNSGMNGHIAKPIDTAILYATLDQVMNESKEK